MLPVSSRVLNIYHEPDEIYQLTSRPKKTPEQLLWLSVVHLAYSDLINYHKYCLDNIDYLSVYRWFINAMSAKTYIYKNTDKQYSFVWACHMADDSLASVLIDHIRKKCADIVVKSPAKNAYDRYVLKQELRLRGIPTEIS